MTDNQVQKIALHLRESLGSPQIVAKGAPRIGSVLLYERGLGCASLWVTTNLSEHPLPQRSRPPICVELVFIGKNVASADVVGLLGVLAEELVSRGKAPELGEVFGPAGPLFDGASVTSLYATDAVVLGDRSVLGGSPPIFFVWLMPLTAEEALLARNLGRGSFEDRLRSVGEADIFNMKRATLIR